VIVVVVIEVLAAGGESLRNDLSQILCGIVPASLIPNLPCPPRSEHLTMLHNLRQPFDNIHASRQLNRPRLALRSQIGLRCNVVAGSGKDWQKGGVASQQQHDQLVDSRLL
jgi:hypothetical protein